MPSAMTDRTVLTARVRPRVSCLHGGPDGSPARADGWTEPASPGAPARETSGIADERMLQRRHQTGAW